MILKKAVLMCVLVLEVCVRGVCPWPNPVITRPGRLRQGNGRRAGQGGESRDGSGPDVEQGVRQQQRSVEMTFSLTT